MNTKKKILTIFSFVLVILLAISISYAFFYASVTGLDSASTIATNSGNLLIDYSEHTDLIELKKIYPRNNAWAVKTITIKGTNNTTLDMRYDLGLNVETNTFGHYLSYDLKLVSGNNGSPIPNITGKAIVGTGYKRFGIGSFTTANEEIHQYELSIYFKNNGRDQNDAQEGIFNAKVTISDAGSKDPNEIPTVFLTGSEVNIKMKNLANQANGNSTVVTAATTENTTITSIQRSNTLKSGLTDTNIVSTSTSKYPIYMWYENGTIYYYTEAKHPQLNSDASYMFSKFSNLADISGLSDMDASNSTNFLLLLANDYKISDLTPLSTWDTSNVTNMAGLFQNNASLTNLHGLENWNTSSVPSMQNLFYCSASRQCKLTDLSALLNWDTSKVENMQAMFQSQLLITDLHGLENWDTSKVNTMYSMFANNPSLTNIQGLEDWDTSNVTNMKFMFGLGDKEFNTGSRSSLTDIGALSNWDTSKVENMESMFQFTAITSLKPLTNWNTSSVTNLKWTFASTINLTTLEGLENWDVSNVTNYYMTFGVGSSPYNAGVRSALTDASAINDWNIKKTANFTGMFQHISIHPEFTKVAGTWNNVGTFTPSN